MPNPVPDFSLAPAMNINYGGGSLSEPRGAAGLTQTSTFEDEVEDR